VTRRAYLLVMMALLLAVAGFAVTGSSSATFVAQTGATASISSAADWTPPTVTLANPGTPVKDTVTLTATAADGETGIKNVVISTLAAGGSAWVDLCTATSAPYSCAWNTKLVTDGSYTLRATATDNAGYDTTTDPITTTVANNVLVVLGDPGDTVRGTVSLPTTLFGTGTSTYTVRVEYAVAASGNWKTLCTGLSSPYTCSWVTSGFANGDYDLRSVATSGGTSYTSAVVADVLVDNLAPTVSMIDPGSPLSGTRTFAATADDAHSGIAQVVIEYAASGTTTYKSLCTVTTSPFSCRVDTTSFPDGSFAFRAVATDVAGNTTTSAIVANRVVDNTVSSVSMEDPGAFLTGTVQLSATANSTAGVTSVRIQRAPTGTSTWTDVCTDATAPFTCPWNTTTVTDGSYDFRAVLVDGAGRTTTSATVAARRVDNSPLRGLDVQATNGGANPGRLENGDAITFTYSDQINPASVTTGWSGAATAVSVRLRDGNLLGLGNRGDTLDVRTTGANGVAVNLGSVNLKEEFVKSNKTVTFASTMTATTVTINGKPVTVITVRLGAPSGTGLRTASVASTMVWTPSASAVGPTGVACSPAPVTETGALDRDF
jgi:hypothetical protein